MPKLADLVKAVQQDLPVTVRMERWLIDNADPKYSEEAIKFSDDFLRGKVGGHRHRRPAFRASGMGKCARSRVFARLGVVGESEQFSSAQANVFATGNFYHRKWQMGGLTEGWLKQAEVPFYNEEIDLGGTADGIIYDGSLLEIKSINDRGYKWVAQTKTPKDDHMLQVGAYKLLKPDLTAASIIYENKNNGEWREYRVYFTDELMTKVEGELAGLRRSIRERVLPEVKETCLVRSGTEYRQCPFRDTCLSLHRKGKLWPQGMAESAAQPRLESPK